MQLIILLLISDESIGKKVAIIKTIILNNVACVCVLENNPIDKFNRINANVVNTTTTKYVSQLGIAIPNITGINKADKTEKIKGNEMTEII